MAAVLARGDRALLSYGSAAWLWRLVPALELPVEVSVPWRGHRKDNIHAHHCPALRDEDATSYDDIPVTGVARTLLDIASQRRGRRLEDAIERCRLQGRLDLAAIDRLLEEVRGHPGRKKLRLGVEMYRDPAVVRSGGELRILEVLRDAGLPRPKVNNFVEGFEVDLYWEPERFAVELDGWDAHRTRAAFESDPRRQEDLKLAGIELVRFTGRRLNREPDQIAERIGLFLARRREELGLEPRPRSE
jgi:very-short-patch-repair endonuclease